MVWHPSDDSLPASNIIHNHKSVPSSYPGVVPVGNMNMAAIAILPAIIAESGM